jgi:hypothetical protein
VWNGTIQAAVNILAKMEVSDTLNVNDVQPLHSPSILY